MSDSSASKILPYNPVCWPKCYSIPEILLNIPLKRGMICSSGLDKSKQIYLSAVLEIISVLSSEGGCRHRQFMSQMQLQHWDELPAPGHRSSLPWAPSPAGHPLVNTKTTWNNLGMEREVAQKLSLPSALPRAELWGVLMLSRGRMSRVCSAQQPTQPPGTHREAPAPTAASPQLLLHPQGLTQLPLPDFTWTFWLSLNTSSAIITN